MSVESKPMVCTATDPKTDLTEPVTKKYRMTQSWYRFREFVHTSNTEAGFPPRGPTPIPAVRWTDRQRLWDLMCKKERGMYVRLPGSVLLERHPCIQAQMRSVLLDWLNEVCEVYKLHRETFYLAVDFLDRYLGTSTNLHKSRLQLIGVTCLFIAAKIEEIYPPKVREFAYVTDDACTEDNILTMELVILKGLNWGLCPMTPNSWVKLYMQINQAAYIVEINGENPEDNKDFVLPLFSGSQFSRIMMLLDLCILDIGSLSFPYSVLAASAIYHFRNEEEALQASGYTWDDISTCVNWMLPFVFALREFVMMSPDWTLPDVGAHDVHNIQVHSFDLSVLENAQKRQAKAAEQQSRQSPDLILNPTRLISSVEMTPPDDDMMETGYINYKDPRVNEGQVEVVPASSSVFMSP